MCLSFNIYFNSNYCMKVKVYKHPLESLKNFIHTQEHILSLTIYDKIQTKTAFTFHDFTGGRNFSRVWGQQEGLGLGGQMPPPPRICVKICLQIDCSKILTFRETTLLSQLVNKLATSLLRRHLVDKLLEQHCHNLLTSLLQSYCKHIL
jgi:hypothetical protein